MTPKQKDDLAAPLIVAVMIGFFLVVAIIQALFEIYIYL